MNLNKSAMLKAALVGFILTFIIGAIAGAVGAATATDATTTDAAQGILGGTSLVSTILGLLATILTGALYGYFARREGTPVDTGNYSVGGALTTLLLGVVGLVLAVIAAAIGLSLPGVNIPDTVNEGALAGALTAAALVSLVINMVVGAIGGTIYAATHRTETTTTTPSY